MKDSLKILLLEDNAADAKLLKRALSKSFGNFVLTVIETKEEYLAELKKPFDIVISDYVLPSFDGMEALQIRNKQKPFLPFIITTGSTNEATAVNCMKAGANDYVIKEHITRIGEAVKSAIAQKKIEYEKQIADLTVQHLNRILKAIRNINQLITREKDKQKLIQQACEMFTHEHSYVCAWISLYDKNGKLGTINAFSGIDQKHFTPLIKNLRKNKFPPCVIQATKTNDVVGIPHNEISSGECPLGRIYPSNFGLTKALVYQKKRFGIITVRLPVNITINKEETDLFREVTGDISYALHNIEIEKEKQETTQRQKVLLDIAKAAVIEEKLENFIAKVFGIIEQIVEYEHAYLALYDAEKHQYYFPFQRYKDGEIYPDTMSDSKKGLIEYIRRRKKLLVLTKSQVQKLEQKGEIEKIGPYAAAWMGIPLISKGNFIGVMALQHFSNPHAFTVKDEELLNFISTQLALFIERKEALAQLKASNERYKTVMQQAGDAIFLIDMEGNILDANDTAIRNLGYTLKELKTKKASDFDPFFISEKHKERILDKFVPERVV